MAKQVDAKTLKSWLSDGRELALIDVREAGQFGEAHLFFAVPLPYSRFEVALPALLPNPAVRLVFCDAGDGIAERAADRAEALGYRDVHVLAGGIEGWKRAGYTLYAGVNVPSKTFGELIEHERHTPRVTAEAVENMREAGENFVIVDGRPLAEYRRMNIPGGICCPNGELALRIREHRARPQDQDRRQLRRPHALHHRRADADRFRRSKSGRCARERHPGVVPGGPEARARRGAGATPSGQRPPMPRTSRRRPHKLAAAHGAAFVAPAAAAGWLADASRTTYLLDVRTPEEFAARAVPGFVHAPGGQLIQATDQWVASGVRGSC